MIKKLLALVLASLMLTSALTLAACSKDDDTKNPDTSKDSETETDTETDTENDILGDLAAKDFDGQTFNVLAAVEEWQYHFITEYTGEALNDAIYNRNIEIADRYKIDYQYKFFPGFSSGMASVIDALRANFEGGTGDYDMAIGSISYLYQNVYSGYLMDLDTVPHLSLDEPWYMQGVNEEMKKCGKNMLVAGFADLNSLCSAFVTFVNPQVARDAQIETDFMALAREGKWTYDEVMKHAEIVGKEVDGKGERSSEDIYGITSSDDYIKSLAYSFGYKYSTVNEDGTLTLTGPTEKAVDINTKVYNLINDTSYIYYSDGYTAMRELFPANRNLFVIQRIDQCEYEEFLNMEEYKILPAPKYDESQANYVTSVVPDVFGIPAIVKDIEMSALVFETMFRLGYDDIYPEYYEKTLKRRYVFDMENAEMIDIIYANTYCDFLYMNLYLEGVSDYLFKIGKTNNYVSATKSSVQVIENLLQSKREALIENE